MTIYEKLLDVFGKQTLDLISKGETVEELIVENSNDNNSPSSNEENILKTSNDYYLPSDLMTDNEAIPPIKADRINQHYQEDEKKNLDAIRKMLLKNRG